MDGNTREDIECIRKMVEAGKPVYIKFTDNDGVIHYGLVVLSDFTLNEETGEFHWKAKPVETMSEIMGVEG